MLECMPRASAGHRRRRLTSPYLICGIAGIIWNGEIEWLAKAEGRGVREDGVSRQVNWDNRLAGER